MAAKWAGCAGTFDTLPKYQRIDIIASYEIDWRMSAINAYESTRERKARG